MESNKRMMVNTLVQYVRSGIYMVLMLFTTRLVMAALGHEGFGVYSVIGSTVFLMGFVTNSLAASTQRFLSFSTGRSDVTVLSSVFANAVLLHAAIAVGLVVAMALLQPVFLGGLAIPDSLRGSASFVYYMVLAMVLLSFLASPVRALFIARENIIYVSVIEIIDSLLKFGGALALPFITLDTLKVYSVMMASVSLFNLLAYFVYGCIRYGECHIPRLREASREQMRHLTGFAVWNVYSVGAGIARTQGLAYVVNSLGLVVNAAYGVALQVQNALGFIVQSILNAMNPQLMRAEGAGDRQRMLLLSTKESKYSTLILIVLLTPLVFEMPGVLRFWLGDVPEHAVMFCRYSLVALMLDQLTIGLTSANQAIGRIRNYTLLVSTLRILELPLAWYFLRLGLPADAVMWAYVGVEVIIGVVRVWYLRVTAALDVRAYLGDVFCRSIASLAVILVLCRVFLLLPDHPFRFLLTESVAVLLGAATVFVLSLTREERSWVKQQILRKKNH